MEVMLSCDPSAYRPDLRDLRKSRRSRILRGNGEIPWRRPSQRLNSPETSAATACRRSGEAVAVSSHGQVTGYFIGPDDYEEFKRFREQRHSFATADLPEEKVRAIAESRMDPRHANLDGLLDQE